MANIRRYRVVWSGFTGSPGVSTFYFSGSVDPAPDLHTLFNAISAAFPSQVRWDFPTQGDTISDSNGALVGAFASAGAAQVPGSGSNLYSSATGIEARWNTGVVIGKRRLLGKTFLVPADGAAYGSGVIVSGLVTTLQTAFTAWHSSTAGAAQLVWHRPKAGVGGSSSPVSSVTIPNKIVVLRSRRD